MSLFGIFPCLRRASPSRRRRTGALAATVGAILAAGPAIAEEPLSVTVDKAHVLRLDSDASLVMVANPDIADVTIESPRLLFVLGRAAGETNLYVLDGGGREILNTALVVVPNDEREVTINRNLKEGTLSCDPRCVRVPTPRQDANGVGASNAAMGDTQTAGLDSETDAAKAEQTAPQTPPVPPGVDLSSGDEALNPEDVGVRLKMMTPLAGQNGSN